MAVILINCTRTASDSADHADWCMIDMTESSPSHFFSQQGSQEVTTTLSYAITWDQLIVWTRQLTNTSCFIFTIGLCHRSQMAAAQKSTQLVRPDLKDYCPASNLAFNEKITNLINAGEEIFHFGFGQAPFPVLECMCDALKEHAGENAYLPVTGQIFNIINI